MYVKGGKMMIIISFNLKQWNYKLKWTNCRTRTYALRANFCPLSVFFFCLHHKRINNTTNNNYDVFNTFAIDYLQFAIFF